MSPYQRFLGKTVTALAAIASMWACSASSDPLQGLPPSEGNLFDDDPIGVGGGGQGDACAVASALVASGPVDVIIAIDQSASMGQEIQGVIDNLNTNLVQILADAGLDYRVIFISSLTGLPSGPDYVQVNAGVNSSDALTQILWTYDGYVRTPNTCDRVAKPDIAWSDELRYESHKIFIAVTDDDPSSFGCAGATANCNANFGDCIGCASSCAGYCPTFQCPTYADQPAEWGGDDFPTELYKLAPAGMFGSAGDRKWTFHAIVPVSQQLGPQDAITPLNDVCDSGGNTGETSGVEYQKLAALSGGLRFPSCDTDYSPVFQSIASTITPLACKFNLEQTDLGEPDPNLTNVEIDFGNGKETVVRDDTAPCDGGADGWQFTDDYSAIVLCGAACERLKNTPGASVNITLGCKAVIR